MIYYKKYIKVKKYKNNITINSTKENILAKGDTND